MKELPCTKSFWQFHLKEIQCSLIELLSFSAFVNLFKYTALSIAYKLADTLKNYCCSFDLRELLYLVYINARLEKMQLAFFLHIYICIYLCISSHIRTYYILTIYTCSFVSEQQPLSLNVPGDSNFYKSCEALFLRHVYLPNLMS